MPKTGFACGSALLHSSRYGVTWRTSLAMCTRRIWGSFACMCIACDRSQRPDELYRSAAPGYTGMGPSREPSWWEDKTMRVQQPRWSVLVAAVLVGLVGVTAVAAGGAQFIPVLGVRE